MRPNRIALLAVLAVLAVLTTPVTAAAHSWASWLPAARGRTAISRYERDYSGTVEVCHRRNAVTVVCRVTDPKPQEEAGEGAWAEAFQIEACLTGHRIVLYAVGYEGALASERL